MPLTNKEKQYMFINHFDHFYVDLLYLNDSKHIFERVNGPKFISVHYNSSNHRLYLELLPDKTSESVLQTFKNFQQYVQDKFPDQQIEKLVFDDGSEYHSCYKDYLKEQGIQYRVVNPNIKDNLVLAPINSYCRYIRSWIQQKLLQEQQEEIDHDTLFSIVSKINEEHNFARPIASFKNKFPADITLEDVTEQNKLKKMHDQTVDLRDDFVVGDFVQAQLLKENDLDKARIRKWSYGTYVIINRVSRFYQISPVGFSQQQFTENLTQDVSIPVYFRKPYQLKHFEGSIQAIKYFPLEMEQTREFQFERIIEAVDSKNNIVTDFDEFQKYLTGKYLIEIYDGRRFHIKVNTLRTDEILHKAELDFWFVEQKAPGVKYTMNVSYM
ncbi:Conserved_hypothetical protein [Hexamita inflata]|uniref:Integrase catalytic domain-containing protein n=1 Tax=Hexamita inflata TaxID=28002 RepID=A0AA86P8G5_9EUKA|nr:Conserved hypothetical protein [Hexamita inflata]